MTIADNAPARTAAADLDVTDLERTWSEYVEALAALREHRTAHASQRVQRALDAAIAQGRKLQNTARTLRSQTR